MFGDISYNSFCNYISFFAIFVLMFFIGSNKKYKNFLISLFFSSFVILELLSISFVRENINEEFLFFLTNIEIYHLTLSTTILIMYYFFLFFVFLWMVFYFILNNLQIQKFRKIKYIFFLILCIPNCFFYNIFRLTFYDYAYSYFKYYSKTYQEIFQIAKNEDYVEKDNLMIFNQNEKHKNLVLIYLESYDQSLLDNEQVKPYTKNINQLTKENFAYKNMEQESGCWGTVPGIICSQCGLRYNAFHLIKNPYGKIRNTQLVCLGDILNLANYNQIFIGGADKKLFNKGNFLLSHNYLVEDKDSLVSKYSDLNESINDWGVPDYDIFEIAKEKYLELSKSNKPFNINILTTATHNPSGIYDKRCFNTSNEKLLNAVECTDYLVNDFINFLKQQKNFKDTLIIIMPDHIQYEVNALNKTIKTDEKKLYSIIINGNNNDIKGNMYYTEFPSMILQNLNIQTNANFLGHDAENNLVKHFIHKIH